MNKKSLLVFLVLSLLSFQIVFAETIIPNPLDFENLEDLLNGILIGLVSIGGSVFVLLIVISGAKLMTSMGDPSAMKKAKDTIWYCSLGLIVLLASQAIYNFVSTIWQSN